jgi:hypothetical protein
MALKPIVGLIGDMVSPMRKALSSVAKDSLKTGVKAGKVQLKEDLIRQTALDRIGSTLIAPMVEADFLPGVETLNPDYQRLANTVWEFLETMDVLGKYFPDTKKIQIHTSGAWPESTGVHELTHYMFDMMLTPKAKKAWSAAVETYGEHPRAFYSVEWARANWPKDALNYYSVKSLRDEESLTNTIQDILSPGREIEASLGLLVEVEKIFNAPGLIDRVAHRLPREMAEAAFPPMPPIPKVPKVWQEFSETATRRRFEEGRGFGTERYPKTVKVKVTMPDGDVFEDEIKGLNKGHAIGRALQNWPGATVEEVI